MRNSIYGGAMLVGLALLAPASAQNRPPPTQPSEIIVEGTRNREREVAKFVDALTQARAMGQISRFEEDVCPEVMGLAANQNEKVAARIRRVAAAAGISVGKDKCKPNLFVVVAEDKEKMVKALREKWADPLGDRVRVPKESGPAVALHLEGRLDSDGIPAGVKQDEGSGQSGYYVTEKASSDASWRIKPGSRPHFLATALIVEEEALAGLTTIQLADYAAMRLLARTDPSRLEKSAAPTILNVLEAPMGSEVPLTMTQWDFGFLKALYGSGENRYATQQRTEMRRILSKELEQGQENEGK